MRARGGPRAPVLGVVDEFDDLRGIGWVRGDDGRRLFFHCTAVADGSRQVAVGTRVVCTVVAGHGGQFEASAVTPVTAAPTA